MRKLYLLPVAAAIISFTACQDTSSPTEPVAETQQISALSAKAAAAARSGLRTTLSTVVTGTVTTAAGAVGTFTGTETITSFTTNRAGDLIANVRIVGTSTVGAVATPVTSTAAVPAAALGSCPILNLDLGAIHLNLLGLVIDLAPVNLDIVAQPGIGNLVGNLLCVIVNLLDAGAIIGIINNLIALLNGLLG